MTRAEADEGVTVLRSLLSVLTGTVLDATTDAAADLRRAAGEIDSLAPTKVRAWGFGAEIAACFSGATEAGATFATMGRVVTSATATVAVGAPAIAIAILFLRLALIEQATILAATTFVSRDDADAALSAVNGNFEPAEDVAADSGAIFAHRALVALHAAVVRDLGDRSRPLPRMVRYSLPVNLPSLVLSNRLYGTADRADEISAENHVTHPLFMPRAGRALSA